MPHPLLDCARIDVLPEAFLPTVGEVFAVFARSQDSGNHSYGVRVGAERFFVKTAGPPDGLGGSLSHAERVALLRNAASLHTSFRHPALPRLHTLIESPAGPMLVYAWVDGELLGVPRERRGDPSSPYQRFRALPVATICHSLDTLYELHGALGRAGWVAADFYDGCLIYNFAAEALAVIDIDMYHHGPFVNTRGRMFGSERFMAPEEFVRGATIDGRSSVFTMGRTALLFLGDGTLNPTAFRGPPTLYAVLARACDPEPVRRFPSLEAFWSAWRVARAP
ncbi:MAG: serine/threonine protein kinase [Chloroflexi bacterium OHK40]